MRILKRTGWGVALVLALATGPSACGNASSDGHAGHGVVKELDADARKVTLDHEDIPGFMKAMTMTFDLAPGIDLSGINPGSTVDFRVKEDGGVYRVTELRRSD